MGKALVRGSCCSLECLGDCVSSASFVLSGPLSRPFAVQRCEVEERERATAKRG